MEIQCGKNVSISTMWRSLVYCGITRKKLHKAAKERNELLRSAFMARIGSQYTSNQLIFLDESSKDERTISRGYGYSELNTRAVKKVVFIRGKRYTLLPAFTLDGIIAIDIIEGSCTKDRFKEFVISQVLPQMNSFPHERSVLILDNARIHHNDGLLEYLNAFGVYIEFLPPYSPDLNPIELAFRVSILIISSLLSCIKSYLKRYQYFVESCSDPIYPLLVACSQITPLVSNNFFNAAGYK